MKRLDPTLNSGSTQYFNGNRNTGAPGTVPQADALNHLQEELAHLVESAGLTLGESMQQVLEAIRLTIAAEAVPGLPAGSVIHVAMAAAPAGYLKADGNAVSRTTYAALFAAIGTTFGIGDGASTFGLPDLRGNFIRGWADGGFVDGGRALGTLQEDALKSHHHDYFVASGPQPQSGSSTPCLTEVGPAQTSDTGDTETRPRNVALLACIKH